MKKQRKKEGRRYTMSLKRHVSIHHQKEHERRESKLQL